MPGLVQANFAPAGKADLCYRSPSFFVNGRAYDTFFRQVFHLGLKVVTHEIELVTTVVFGRMKGCFRGRQCEDQPAVTGIDGRQSKHIAKENAVCVRILAKDDDMGTRNHDVGSLTPASDAVR